MLSSLTRRDVMRTGFLAGAGVLFGIRTGRGQIPVSSGGFMTSPYVRPWIHDLPIPQLKEPEISLPDAAVVATDHQRYTECYPQKLYVLRQQEAMHEFHADLPQNPIWGFDGTYPGPLFCERYGVPTMVRIYNELPTGSPSGGYGISSTSTHLHNLHSPSESDGFPSDYVDSGEYRDHHYTHVKAGFSDPYATSPDQCAREALGTLWYHDHREGFTAQNTYKGLAGMYFLFDELDSGDETDLNPAALRLPSGKYDVPLFIQDKLFDGDGQLFFDLFNFDGMLGDLTAVNGKILPVFHVDRRKYRFRMLVGGPSRFYDIWLMNDKKQAFPFTYIANDGNLLPGPLSMTNVRIAPAERADIVIDFSKFKAGTELMFVNRAEQLSGRRPTGKTLAAPGQPIMKIVVKNNTPVDPSRVPNALRPLPTINMSEVVAERNWLFERSGGAWAVNGEFFNRNVSRANVNKGSAEIWTLRNIDNGWAHPIHIHFEEFRILSRNGVAPPPHERGRKDVVSLGGPEEIKLFIRFRDWTGKYPMHCHNTVHEDHSMMVRWDITGGTSWG